MLNRTVARASISMMVPPYRLALNWDGAPHSYSPVPQSLEQFLHKVFEPLTGTCVDALFWCVGEHTTTWSGGELEVVGERTDRKYEDAAAWTHAENIRRMLDRGENPLRAIVDRGHELGIAVYASLRMNDNHFDGAQPADLATMQHVELTKLRQEHPEWLLGDSTSEWFALSWNMAVPEVRANRIAHVREMLAQAEELDGIELDWQRHAFHFPTELAYRLRYCISDVQRSVRAMCDEVGHNRGRPVILTARVAGSIAQSRRQGYDLDAWLEEGLVDVLVPAGNAATDDSIDVDEWKALVAKHGSKVAICPGTDSGIPRMTDTPEESNVEPEPAPISETLKARALAARYLGQGADGLYIFNFHQGYQVNVSTVDGSYRYNTKLLTEIGSAASLVGLDKLYVATHRVTKQEGPWRGAFDVDREWGQVPVPLLPTLSSRGAVVDLRLGPELKPGVEVTLRLRLEQWTGVNDRIEVRWDGFIVGPELPSLSPAANTIIEVNHNKWMLFDLSHDSFDVSQGVHAVEVTLLQRNPQVLSTIMLTDVEVLFEYRKPPTELICRTEIGKL